MAIRPRQLAVGAAILALVVALFFGGRAAIVGGGGGGGSSSDPGSGAGSDEASGADPGGAPRRPLHGPGGGDGDPTAIAMGPAVVEGTVRDAVTHQPVAGAQVVFWNKQGEQTTDSRADGHYRIEITVGPWSCGASDGAERITYPQSVKVNPSNPPIDLELQQLAHVHGTVRDAAGRAIAGADVTYEHKDRAVREAFDGSIGRVAQTDAGGGYELAVLPGEVRLRANAPHQLAHRVLPGVAPGADVLADLVLAKLVSIDGRVVDAHGAPVAGAEVTAFVAVIDVDLNAKRVLTSDADGRFAAAGLNPGWLTLSARTGDGAMSKVVPMVELVHGDLHDLILTMVPPGPISGRVVYGDDSPARSAQIKASRVGYAGTWAETSTDDSGAFTFQGPTDGNFDIVATAAAGTGRAQGATAAAPVEIVIHVPGGLRGYVHADKVAATDYTVAIDRFVPAEGQRGVTTPPPQRFMVADGRFEWAHLDDGTYALTVHAAGAAAAHVSATITDGKWTDLDVPLETGAGTTGRVHAGDKPIANARLDVACTGGSTVTSADGRFQLADLPAGGCPVTITADGYAIAHGTAKPGTPLAAAIEAAGGK